MEEVKEVKFKRKKILIDKKSNFAIMGYFRFGNSCFRRFCRLKILKRKEEYIQ